MLEMCRDGAQELVFAGHARGSERNLHRLTPIDNLLVQDGFRFIAILPLFLNFSPQAHDMEIVVQRAEVVQDKGDFSACGHFDPVRRERKFTHIDGHFFRARGAAAGDQQGRQQPCKGKPGTKLHQILLFLWKKTM